MKFTHEVKQIRTAIIPKIFSQLPKIHPFRHKLERFECGAFKWHDIYMVETFPYQGLLAKCLGDLSGLNNRAKDV